MWFNALSLALRQIRRNLLRSFLTTLGITIGVAAVITMVTLGKGATAQVTEQVASLGTNLLMVNRGQRFGPGRGRLSGPSFAQADLNAIQEEIAGITAIAPVANGTATVVVGNASWSSNVRGTDNAYLIAGNWALADGRNFSTAEQTDGASVCIIGQTVVKKVFPSTAPLLQRMRVDRFNCVVIGVLQAKGQTSFGNDQDDLVLMPLATFQRRIAGNRDIEQIYISLLDNIDYSHVEERLTRLLRLRRSVSANEADNFSIMNTTELAETLTSTTQTMTGLLGAVAGVSLLVGGIGVMNIMLVSVTERTREIGTRLAIGALEHEVLLQFLVEAVVLSSLGGLLGVLIAIVLTWVLSVWSQIPFSFDLEMSLVAFLFSSMIGIIFGFLPARRAAQLNPIEALRHE